MRVNQHLTVLLALLRGEPPPASLVEADWQAVAEVAARHGVTPLLYWEIEGKPDRRDQRAEPGGSSGADVPSGSPNRQPATGNQRSLPPSVLAPLREAFLKNAARNALLYQDLGQILTALQGAGMPVEVLKGAHLAALVYPHIGCRRMVDIDLLVPKAHLEQAQAALQQAGFSSTTAVPARDYVQVSHHLGRMYKSFSPSIELHWTLFPPAMPFTISAAGLLARGREVNLSGVATLVLAPEDSVLHQSVHLAVHKFSHHGLRPLCDLAATLTHYRAELNWGCLLVRASEWRAGACLYLALRLAADLLHAPVPQECLSAARPADFDDSYYVLARDAVLAASGDPVPGDLAPEVHRLGRLADGLADNSPSGRLRSVWKLLFPGRQHMAIYLRHYHGLALSGHRLWTSHLVRFMDLVPRGLRYCRHALCHREAAARRAAQLQREARLWRWLTTPPK